MDRISVSEIALFFNVTPTIRNMVYRENVLNSEHMITRGYALKDEKIMDVFSTCLQTSLIKDKPHVIRGRLKI